VKTRATRAIEFLTKSDAVHGHHRGFEEGAYTSLGLTGSYLVVDVKPCGVMPELLNSQLLQVVGHCFRTAWHRTSIDVRLKQFFSFQTSCSAFRIPMTQVLEELKSTGDPVCLDPICLVLTPHNGKFTHRFIQDEVKE
jgi:hypothetical protein